MARLPWTKFQDFYLRLGFLKVLVAILDPNRRSAGNEVLAANTLREMQRVQWISEDLGNYRGFGFSVSRRDGKTFVGHGGSCPGYRSDLLLSMDDQVAVVAMTNAHDVSPSTYTRAVFDLLDPVLTKAPEGEGEGEDQTGSESLRKYTGRYDRPLGGETHVFVLDGRLVTLSVPTENPAGLTKLEQVGEHTFRRVRADGQQAEAVIFEVGPDGEVTRMIRNSNYSIRVR